MFANPPEPHLLLPVLPLETLLSAGPPETPSVAPGAGEAPPRVALGMCRRWEQRKGWEEAGFVRRRPRQTEGSRVGSEGRLGGPAAVSAAAGPARGPLGEQVKAGRVNTCRSGP